MVCSDRHKVRKRVSIAERGMAEKMRRTMHIECSVGSVWSSVGERRRGVKPAHGKDEVSNPEGGGVGRDASDLIDISSSKNAVTKIGHVSMIGGPKDGSDRDSHS